MKSCTDRDLGWFWCPFDICFVFVFVILDEGGYEILIVCGQK